MDSHFSLCFIVIFTSLSKSRNRSEATLRDTGMGLGKYLRYLPHRWMDEQWQFIIQPCLGIGPKSPYAHLATDGFSAHYRPSSKRIVPRSPSVITMTDFMAVFMADRCLDVGANSGLASLLMA